MNTVCRCGHVFGKGEDRYKLGEEVLCEKCITSESNRGNVCPCCKKHIPNGAHEVGLLLTPHGSTALKKARAVEVLAIVCPHCKVLFFDDFTYKTIETLK